MTPLDAGLVLAGGSAALIYGLWLTDAPPTARRTLIKTIPLAAMALIAMAVGGPGLLIAALVFSAIGDAALSRDGEAAFLVGLGSFLLAHLAYVWLFFGQAVFATPGLFRGALVLGLPVFGIWMLRRLWPHLGPMRLPALAYICAILAMGLAAIFVPIPLALIGAGLFIASDALLAEQLFRGLTGRAASRAIWGLYIAGQALILAALIG